MDVDSPAPLSDTRRSDSRYRCPESCETLKLFGSDGEQRNEQSQLGKVGKRDMFILTDTFNKVEISKHRTLGAAVKARRDHLRAVRKANGESSYLTYAISDSSGARIEENEILREEELLHNSGN